MPNVAARFALVAMVFLLVGSPLQAFETSPIGWASVSSTSGTPFTVTGGSAGATVTATTETQFKTYATSTTPYVIIVPTMITMTRGTSSSNTPQTVNLQSNKTIIGVGSNPGIVGGLMISGKSNIIVRNMSISYDDSALQGFADPWTDGITVQSGSQHIWIDHCTIFNSPDGLLDPTKQSDWITISWCKFFYTAAGSNTQHRNCSLVGSSDTDLADLGKLHITFHHNWWADRCKERMPRVRFGQVHVFNNYYSNLTSGGYCHGVGNHSQILAENNYYNAVPTPWKNYSTTDGDGVQGLIHWNAGNFFYNCSVPTWAPNSTVFTPPYAYTLDAGSGINTIVPNGAGVDKLTPSPNPMTFSVAPYALGGYSISMTAATATCLDGVEYLFTCTAGGGHNSAWQTGSTYVDTALTPNQTYTYTVQARNALQTVFVGAVSGTASATTVAVNDVTPPSPDPMTWSVAPHGTDFHSISMTATTAIDDLATVEYLFTCTAGGGHSSQWQDSTTYTDTPLAEGTTASYTVTARDKSVNHNTTAPSTPAAEATTLLDTTPPTPAQMSFTVAPHALGLDSIAMTAVVATDISDVEYYFACTAGGGHDSDWQDSEMYTDTGLANSTTYTYRVITRDKSPQQNENAWSDPNSATTTRYLCTGPITSDLSTDCQVDFLDYAMLASHWSEVLPLTVDTMTNGTFDTDIAPGWQTIALPGAIGFFVASFDGNTGNPPGSAIVGSDTDPDGTSGQWFYQIIPAVAGKQYKLSGEWMGDLSGTVAIDPCNLGNWAELKVAFESGADPNTWTSWSEPNTVMYRKAFGSVTRNIGPTGTWDWEQITSSLTNGPADGVFTATGSYMVVAFSAGGMPASGVGYYYLDNLAVRTSPCPPIDFNGDCILDMKDIAAFAGQWLTCNRNPADECWK